MNPRIAIASLTLLTGGLLGWLIFQQPDKEGKTKREKDAPAVTTSFSPTDPRSERKPRTPSARGPEFDPNAIPNERIVTFATEADYRDFLARLANSRVRNLGTIDALRAVRLGFNNLTDFNSLGLDPDNVQFNYPVNIPETREVEPQDGIVGFGASALEFLGITVDNSGWGRGVKIAIIDTGIAPHPTLTGNIQHISIIDLPDGASLNSHGTSVASLIAGTHPNMRGVAPAADLIDIRIAGQNGSSNSFLLAQGIDEAIKAGAQLINISMGSDGNSLLVQEANNRAHEQGIAVFASSGNSGDSQASWPAQDPNVFAVGAVDANGTHLNFSSSDANLAFTAPGLEVRAAYPGEKITPFTGTSAAVAFPVGATAAIMSESSIVLSPQQAANIAQSYSNEAGLPGQDAQFGYGILDVGRAINRDTPGITDLAVASQSYLLPTLQDSTSGLQISIENRGTEPVYQANVDIQIGDDQFPFTVQSIQPNERRIITIPAGQQQLLKEGSLPVSSAINVPDGTIDSKPSNDQRRKVILNPNGQNNGP